MAKHTDTTTEGDPASPQKGRSGSGRHRWLANLALVLVSVLVALAMCEAGARVYAWAVDEEARSTIDLIHRRPPPYKDSSYFSGRFLAEADKAGGLKGYRRVPGRDYFLPGDRKGQYVNVADAVRRTTDTPPSAPKRILVFGGSTVFSAEVPDGFTIPSSLQRLVNSAFPGTYQVVNLGAGAANVHQQLQRLEDTPLTPSDVVVFYDGVNEVTTGVYLGDPSGSILEIEKDAYEGMNPVRRWLLRGQNELQEHSTLVRLILTPVPREPSHLKTAASVSDLAQRTRDGYYQAIVEANTFVRQKGATFVHFLQPNLPVAQDRTPYERELLDNRYVVMPGVEKSFTATYPLLRATEADFRQAGVTSHDLSLLLEPRSAPGQEFYLDYCHVTDVANDHIARAIFTGLFPDRPVP